MREKIRPAIVSTLERFTRTKRLIAEEEGLRRFAYKDIAGIWTIGIGHKILPTEEHLKSYTQTNQAPDSVIDELFKRDIAIAEKAVQGVGVPLTDNQHAALVSLVFNTGPDAISPTSTIGRALRARNYQAAADGFPLWRKITVNGVKQDSPALLARRQRERTMFLTA